MVAQRPRADVHQKRRRRDDLGIRRQSQTGRTARGPLRREYDQPRTHERDQLRRRDPLQRPARYRHGCRRQLVCGRLAQPSHRAPRRAGRLPECLRQLRQRDGRRNPRRFAERALGRHSGSGRERLCCRYLESPHPGLHTRWRIPADVERLRCQWTAQWLLGSARDRGGPSRARLRDRHWQAAGGCLRFEWKLPDPIWQRRARTGQYGRTGRDRSRSGRQNLHCRHLELPCAGL